jgi:hypothetical protein
MMMRYHPGLGVGHTYAFNLAPQGLDQTATEDFQDPVEESDAGGMAESGPEGDIGMDEADLERSVDGESTDGNTDIDDLEDDGSDRDVESEDEDWEEMYA